MKSITKGMLVWVLIAGVIFSMLPAGSVIVNAEGAGETPELLLHYTFDEASDGTRDAVDSGSQPAADGKFIGSATRTSNTPGGYSSGALDVNYTGRNYVSPGLPASNKVDGLTEMTVSLWVNLQSDPGLYERILSKGSAFEWIINSGTASSISSSFVIGGRYYNLPVFDAHNKWKFFTFSYDGATLKVYCGDTSLSASLIGQMNTVTVPSAPDRELQIGSTPLTTADRTPPAYIDDIRVYKGVLSQMEINTVRGENLAPQEELFTLYVSPEGNDAWSGSLPEPNTGETDGPFATIERARDTIRNVKGAGQLDKPVNVYIREGTYYLDETLVFTPEDSGTEAAPITYCAYPGEKPVISGGRPINGTWIAEDENIYYIDIPEAANGAWKFRSIFANDRREIRARYPNYIENDLDGHSYLYVYPDANQILSGLAKEGDFVEYTFDVSDSGVYDLWMGIATTNINIEDYLSMTIDGQSFPVGPMAFTADWRSVKYSKAIEQVMLDAGSHTLRISNTSTEEEMRVHLDAFVFSDNPGFAPQGSVIPEAATDEHRVVIQAENDEARADGFSSISFGKHVVAAAVPDKVTIHTDPGRIKASWANEPDATIDIVVELHYMNELLQIDSIDQPNGIIKLKGPEAKHPINPSNYFFISGVKEELDAPGEWYLDSNAGRLYYWPREGENPDDMSFEAPYLKKIIEFNGDNDSVTGGSERVRWITLKEFTFKHSTDTMDHLAIRTPTDGALKLINAGNNTIENCHFVNVDGFAVWLHLDSCENTISGNTMEYMGAGGILMTSAKLGYGDTYDSRAGVQSFAPLRNTIVHNYIHHGNQIRVNGAGILLDTRPESTVLMPGNLMAYNEIAHMKRQGIFGFGNQSGNIVAYNYLHHLMTETADGGAVNFAVMNNVTSPTIVKNNLIHDVIGLKREGEGKPGYFGGIGIYPDWTTSHFQVENNVVYNTSFASYLSNGGQFNILANNIFAEDIRTLIDHEEFQTEVSRGNQLFNNVLANTRSKSTNILLGAWGMAETRRYQITEMFKTNPEAYLYSDYNVLWNDGDLIGIEPIDSYESWKAAGMDNHSVAADPLFIDIDSGNYYLKPESPAFAHGFKAFDITNTGVNASEDETLGFDNVSVLHTTVDLNQAMHSGGRTVEFIPQIEQSGSYLVYVKRQSSAMLDVTVNHDGGITKFNMADWVPQESGASWPIYIGTYEFTADTGNSVAFEQSTEQPMNLPAQLIFVQTGKTNPVASYLREVNVSSDTTQMRAGEAVQLNVSGIMSGGIAADPGMLQIQYTSDDPSVASVDHQGIVTGIRNGKVGITATATLDGVTVKSVPIIIRVGVTLKAVLLDTDKAMLKPGEIAKLTVSGIMSDSGKADLSTALIRYNSNDVSVAEVGSDGVIMGKSAGNAVITAIVTLDDITVVSEPLAVRVGDYSLMLHYTFDEDSTGNSTAIDKGAAPAADGNFFGNATRTGNTPDNSSKGALDLTQMPGQGSYVTPGLPNSNEIDGLSQFTITQWINMQDNPGIYDRILSKAMGFDWVINSGSTAASMSTYLALQGRLVTLPAFDADNKWVFAAFTYDGTNLQFYTGDTSTSVTLLKQVAIPGLKLTAPDAELRIGATPLTSADRTPSAYMDDIRVYDTSMPLKQMDIIRRENLKPVDTVPPVTTAEVAGDESNDYYTSDVKVKFTAVDDSSGVEKTVYSLDDGVNWIVYGDPVVLESEGMHNVKYRSIDRAGNVEEAKDIAIKIIFYPPLDGIFSAGRISLDGSSKITGNIYTNSTVTGSVYFSWPAQIDGNLEVGPGVDWNNVIAGSRPDPSENVTGAVYSMQSVRSYSLPVFPDFPDNLPQKGEFKTPWVQGEQYLITEDGSYDLIQATGNRTITIDLGGGERKLRVKKLDIQQGHIVLTNAGENGRLVFYVEDAFNLGGNSTVNADGLCDALIMYYSSSKALNIGGNTKITGSVYARNANLVLGGSGSFKGHVITGGKSVSVTGNAVASVMTIYAPNAALSIKGSGKIKGVAITGSIEMSGSAQIVYNDSICKEFFDLFDLGVE